MKPKAQLQFCQLRGGQIDRQPLRYDPNESVDALIERVLLKMEDIYGSGCYVPLGKSMPNVSGWIEIRAYYEGQNK